MNDENSAGVRAGVHWSFWAIVAFALVWNIGGTINFFMQMDANTVASLPETHRAIIEGRPLWATGGFAVAVFGGALGGLLLLLRKAVAYHVFIASLVGAAVTMLHTANVAISIIDFSAVEILVMIVMPLVVAAFMIWYSKRAERNDWVSR